MCWVSADAVDALTGLKVGLSGMYEASTVQSPLWSPMEHNGPFAKEGVPSFDSGCWGTEPRHQDSRPSISQLIT